MAALLALGLGGTAWAADAPRLLPQPNGMPSVGADDYPEAALRARAEGDTSIAVTVGADGRGAACRVTSGSGNADLDQRSCLLATRRWHYTPGPGEYATTLHWRMQAVTAAPPPAG